MRGQHVFEAERRFITTPRDLATYVRFDALYQAYLNACLILLGSGAAPQRCFPEQGNTPRTGFASFGGPHILSLVTEVATRCLKLARRQKFNFHRRARPERIGGLLTVAKARTAENGVKLPSQDLGQALDAMLAFLPPSLQAMVSHHNARRRSPTSSNVRYRPFMTKEDAPEPDWVTGDNASNNLLLAMAFPEGSPMHPAYAAGHATVAGGCVTMLKAFFRTIDPVSKQPLKWRALGLPFVTASDDGSQLLDVPPGEATVEGELNKLAANISIARNMAGVHYYSDYYDSVRMGERVAVSILVEQALTYGTDAVTMEFRSFDGDVIVVSSHFDGFAAINPEPPLTGCAKDDFNAYDPTELMQRYKDWLFRHMV